MTFCHEDIILEAPYLRNSDPTPEVEGPQVLIMGKAPTYTKFRPTPEVKGRFLREPAVPLKTDSKILICHCGIAFSVNLYDLSRSQAKSQCLRVESRNLR